MNSMGQSGDKKSYRVILLLVVGLTAFSSAMKELNELRAFTRDASNLVASWSHAVTPAPAPAVEIPAQIPLTAVNQIPQVAVEVEVCESTHALKAAEPVEQFQSGGTVAHAESKIKDVGKTVAGERSRRRDPQVAMLKSHRTADIEMLELRKQARRAADLKVMILADVDREAKIALPAGFEFKVPKVKNQRHIVITPEERDMLKSLNRSLNLRSAG